MTPAVPRRVDDASLPFRRLKVVKTTTNPFTPVCLVKPIRPFRVAFSLEEVLSPYPSFNRSSTFLLDAPACTKSVGVTFSVRVRG